MSAPPAPAARRHQFIDAAEPISFPEPTTPTRCESLPELGQNSDLIADPYGNIFCFVCKVSVPKGSSNISQHLEGKKHDTNNRRFPNPQMKQNVRERYVKAAEDQRASLSGSPPSAPAAATVTPAQAPASSAKNTKSPATEPKPSVAPKEQKTALSEKTVEKKPQKKNRSAKNLAIAHKHQNFTIDKSTYIESIIADDEDSDLEEGAKGENGPGAHTTHDLEHRQGPFAPFHYKPPPGPDLFFESTALETEPSGAAAKIRSVLATSSLSTGERPSDLDAKESTKSAQDKGKTDFIPLSNSIDDKAVDKLEEAKREKARLQARQSMHVLKDTNGDELPPWLVDPEASLNVLCSKDSSIALHFEILQFSAFVAPTEEELQSRNEMVLTIESIVKRLWPSGIVHIFGSYATGLYLPSSDIDICIMGTPKGGELDEFKELAQAIRNLPGFARRVNVLSSAKVPLVKILSRKTGMNCDICIGRDNGPRNVPVIKRYLNDYPALRPLLMVIKCFLKQRDLNDPFSGGLGSYSIFLLVVSHLQMLRYNFPSLKANLGVALETFFQLYGRMFNLCLAGIRVKEGGTYFDKFDKYETQPHETIRFSVEDPNDETNELGKNGFAAMRVRKAFSNASMTLRNWARDDQSKAPTPLGSILQFDDDMQIRRSNVILDMEKKGRKVIRDSITEADPKLSKIGQISNQPRGVESGENERGNVVNSGKRGYSPRNRDPRERDPRLMKRRRANINNDHDGRIHGGPSNSQPESGGHIQLQRSGNMSQGQNSYGNRNHMNQNMNAQGQPNAGFQNSVARRMNPNMGYGGQPTYPMHQYAASTPGYQYVNTQSQLGANGGVQPVGFARGGFVPQQSMGRGMEGSNSYRGNHSYGGAMRRGGGKKSRGSFQRGSHQRGSGSYKGR